MLLDPLFEGDENAFYDADAPNGMSQTMRHYVGGQVALMHREGGVAKAERDRHEAQKLTAKVTEHQGLAAELHKLLDGRNVVGTRI